MGALHNGHLQLVKTSVANNDVTVVSIFVNPTQFNDKNDLRLYPRTLDKDCALLETVNCTYAFAPSVEEMYPTEDTRVFNLGLVAEVMEGKYRPGHFNGVAQIVSKLFDIVRPDNAYFGEKDFQQIAVIRAMAAQLGYTFNIVAVPIVREADGLMLVRETRRPGPTDFLRPGDVIAAIGGMRIRTTADLVNAFRRERLANQVLMQIVRDGRPYYARMLLQ